MDHNLAKLVLGVGRGACRQAVFTQLHFVNSKEQNCATEIFLRKMIACGIADNARRK